MSVNVRISVKFLYIFAMAALIGCGGSESGETTIVKGVLLDNGKPFSLDQSKISLPKGATGLPPGSEDSMIRITFIPVGSADQYPATYHAETGTFEVLGPSKKGIKVGKYKIAITGNLSISKGKEGGEGDYFNGKFTADKTQINREVKAGEEIKIDISKPEG